MIYIISQIYVWMRARIPIITPMPTNLPLILTIVSQLVSVPDPFPVCVVKPVGQPLRLQQLVPLRVQEQGLPTSVNNQVVI